jgi:mono/diheme cytochrome c family protein
MNKHVLYYVSVIVFATVSLSGCSHMAMIPYLSASLPENPSNDRLQNGANLYTLQCMKCHGETGEGDGLEGAELQTTPSNLILSAREKSPNVLLAWIALGKGEDMPSFKAALSQDEMWDIVLYLKEASAPNQ